MMELPSIPCSFDEFPRYLEDKKTQDEVLKAVKPFKDYETKLRQIFAQEPDHRAIEQSHLIPLFKNGSADIKIRARDPDSQTADAQEKYLLPLSANQRRADGTHAVTSNLRDFRRNLNIFSESALTDLNWDNLVVAGSCVVTALLPVDAPHNESKVSRIIIMVETLLTQVNSVL